MRHEDLEVWKAAIDLVDEVYAITKMMPDSERYGLVSQIQRAAVSIPANIAEGCGRQTTKDLLRFLSISQGSLAEVATYLIIIERREWVDVEALRKLYRHQRYVAKMLTALQKSLRQKAESPVTGHRSPVTDPTP